MKSRYRINNNLTIVFIAVPFQRNKIIHLPFFSGKYRHESQNWHQLIFPDSFGFISWVQICPNTFIWGFKPMPKHGFPVAQDLPSSYQPMRVHQVFQINFLLKNSSFHQELKRCHSLSRLLKIIQTLFLPHHLDLFHCSTLNNSILLLLNKNSPATRGAVFDPRAWS